MRNTSLALIAFALTPAVLCAQEEGSLVDRMREYERSLYPSFVSEAEAQREETEQADEQATEATPAPQVLVDDLSSTFTWTSTLRRIDPGMEELQVLLLTAAPPGQLASQAMAMRNDLLTLSLMAPYHVPQQQDSVRYYQQRLDRQLQYLVEDYRAGDSRSLNTTGRLIEQSLGEFRATVELGRAQYRGEDPLREYAMPDDWNAGSFSLPDFEARISPWNSERLLDHYENRRRRLARDMELHSPEHWDRHLAQEMGALARALARRSHELPPSSQVGFKHAALQLDVLAEALYDYVEEENKLYARRQMREVARAVEAAQAFFRTP